MEGTRDGLWHADPKAGHHTVERTTVRHRPSYVVIVSHLRAYSGHWHRFTAEGGWEHAKCPHNHSKRSAAIKCAEQSAKRANKSTTSELDAD